MMNRDIPGMINLDNIIGQEKMHLKLFFDKLMDQIMIKWQKKRENNSSFDYGGLKLIKVIIKFCNFIDALGEAFSENYERILESEKFYDLKELQEAIEKWSQNRQADAIGELIDILGIKACKTCRHPSPNRAKYCPKCGAEF